MLLQRKITKKGRLNQTNYPVLPGRGDDITSKKPYCHLYQNSGICSGINTCGHTLQKAAEIFVGMAKYPASCKLYQHPTFPSSNFWQHGICNNYLIIIRNSPQKAVLQRQAEYADFSVCIDLPSESLVDGSHSELMAMQLRCLSRTGRSQRQNPGLIAYYMLV